MNIIEVGVSYIISTILIYRAYETCKYSKGKVLLITLEVLSTILLIVYTITI